MQNFIRQIKHFPFAKITIPFSLGIATQLIYKISSDWYIYVFASLCTVYFVFLLIKFLRNKYHFQWILGVLNLLVFYVAGLYFTSIKTSSPDKEILKINKGVTIGVIDETPIIKEKTVKIVIEIETVKDAKQTLTSDNKAIVYIEKDSLAEKLCFGDKIMLSINFSEIKNQGNPHEFDYKQYLAYRDIHLQGYVKKNLWKKISSGNGFFLIQIADQARTVLLNIYRKYGLSGNEFGVLSALTLGYTSEIDAETKQAYSATGAMHILSVSGLHVGIIFAIISFLLKFVLNSKKGKIIKTCLIILFLWFFAIISGLSAACNRAALMFSLVLVAKAINRDANIYHIVAISAFVLLLINPFYLADIGFQLSFVAVISIVYFYPKIYWQWKTSNFILNQIWALISVSIAAQLGTFPLCLYYFHQFPVYFLVTNLIAIPLSTIILYLGIGMFVFSFIEPVVSIVGQLLYYLVKILNGSLFFIENLPYSTISYISINLMQLFVLYFIVFAIIAFFEFRKSKYLQYTFAGTILFLSFVCLHTFQNKKQTQFIVYNAQGGAYNFLTSNRNILMCDEQLINNEWSRKYAFENNWIKTKSVKETIYHIDSVLNKKNLIDHTLFVYDNFIQFSNQRIAIVKTDDLFTKKPKVKIHVDYVILSNNSAVTVSDIIDSFEFKEIIIDSSNFLYRKNQWIEECKKHHIKYFSVQDSGAFVKVFYN